MKHPVEWHTASPLWDRALAGGEASPPRFKQPAILRFADDDFMTELQGVLAKTPADLAGYVARTETWRAPGVGWRTAENSAAIKLYQPAHQRHYLVAASLVCQLPGLPERRVDAASEERVAFVIRRLVPDPQQAGSTLEQGRIGDGQTAVWTSLGDAERLAEGEELLPMFALTFELEGIRRRLHAGLLPVASRELYETAEGDDPGLYTVRCVYLRPRCAPFEEPVISQPCHRFRFASFFDPDAPTRSLEIRLPIDTSEDGWGAFPKGVAFLISNQLQRQLARLEGRTPGQVEEGRIADEPSGEVLGRVCSLSIPIITICAFVLLLLMVSLLHLVFRWKRFFKVCRDIPR